jgi:hypothetical protein
MFARASVRGLVAAFVLVALAPGSASAALSASVANLTLAPVTFSHNQQVSTGSMTLTASAGTLDLLGWNVTIQASTFAYSGPNGGTNIPASNFALTSAAAPVLVSGQAIDATGGPTVPATSPLGTLDVARKVLQANVTFGKGTYTQALGVSMTIPAQARAGTYTTSLTTTISAGP